MSNPPSATAPAPLSGIRVLDLGRVIAAPYASQMLADYGADVIKIERPRVGDDSRQMTAGCLLDRQGNKILSDTSMILLGNRNKKSVTVELAKPEGQKIIHRLAAESDVFIENFVPGTVKRFGIDYDTLSAINPRLIYCSVSGWGQDGPYRLRPGYDAVLQAATGFMSVTGRRDGTPGAGPLKVGTSVIDVATGMNAAFAIMMALRQRDMTGEGQYIDVALYDTGIALQADNIQKYIVNGDLVGRHGDEVYGGAPARIFSAADGDVFVIAGMDNHFAALCALLGCTDLQADERFRTLLTRFANRDELSSRLAPLIRQWKVADIVAALEKSGVPCSPVNDYEQVFNSPHTAARRMSIHAEHPQSDGLNLIGSPMKLSKAQPRYQRPPMLGEHTDQVLRDSLGMDEETLGQLRSDGVI